MTEYTKLTVVKLKEFLKDRGLPVSGKKAELVERLEENDAQDEAEVAEAAENPDQDVIEQQELPVLVGLDGAADAPDSDAAPEQPSQDAPDSAQPPKEDQDGHRDELMEAEPEDVPHEASLTKPVEDEKEEVALQSLPPDPPAVLDALSVQQEEDTRPLNAAQPTTYVAPTITPSQQPTTSIETPAPSQPPAELQAPVSKPDLSQLSVQHIVLGSTQSSLNTEEVIEDTRKRKRRSQSPPMSTAEIAIKKAKALDGSPRTAVAAKIESQEEQDIATQEPNQEKDEDVDLPDAPQETSQTEAPESEGMDVDRPHEVQPIDLEETKPKLEQAEEVEAGQDTKISFAKPQISSTSIKAPPASPSKPPAGGMFKSLFTNATDAAPQTPTVTNTATDRNVEPAVHPATRALYIRNLKRPLQLQTFRSHLEGLARSPDTTEPESDQKHGQSQDASLITTFFLDNVRTHCFVRFTSISAASRVRSALHATVWPEEKDRDALWIDYVPEEKLLDWIATEEDAAAHRGGARKRWGVRYLGDADDEEGVIAELVESDGASAPFSVPTAGRPAATAPRHAQALPKSNPSRKIRTSISNPEIGHGTNFKTLDDLYPSTTTKPKLYYLPASKVEVEKRLALLAEGKGRGRGDDMVRFSFEDGQIVNRGPEYGFGRGARGRGGGFAGRGGRGGMIAGRGGAVEGYRGDRDRDRDRDRGWDRDRNRERNGWGGR